jgi:hypothetical protein
MSPAISALLLIMIAIGSGASVYVYASSFRPTNINVAVEGIQLSRANTGSGTWVFNMNLHNIGNVPFSSVGSVTGPGLSQSIGAGTLYPDDRGYLTYLWTASIVPGERYLVTWEMTGTEGSKKTVLTSVTADG